MYGHEIVQLKLACLQNLMVIIKIVSHAKIFCLTTINFMIIDNESITIFFVP